MRFQFIYKIAVIYEMFLVLLNLLQRVVQCASLCWNIEQIKEKNSTMSRRQPSG